MSEVRGTWKIKTHSCFTFFSFWLSMIFNFEENYIWRFPFHGVSLIGRGLPYVTVNFGKARNYLAEVCKVRALSLTACCHRHRQGVLRLIRAVSESPQPLTQMLCPCGVHLSVHLPMAYCKHVACSFNLSLWGSIRRSPCSFESANTTRQPIRWCCRKRLRVLGILIRESDLWFVQFDLRFSHGKSPGKECNPGGFASRLALRITVASVALPDCYLHTFYVKIEDIFTLFSSLSFPSSYYCLLVLSYFYLPFFQFSIFSLPLLFLLIFFLLYLLILLIVLLHLFFFFQKKKKNPFLRLAQSCDDCSAQTSLFPLIAAVSLRSLASQTSTSTKILPN